MAASASASASSSSIVVAGKHYAYVDQHPPQAAASASNALPILGLTGFPDQWYGWQPQIDAWSNAGYRVIVPHMLGYGDSDKPTDPAAYSTKNLCRDLALLLDGLQLPKVILVAHDWGAAVAWRFALWYPHRVAALVALSVPYFPPSSTYVSPSDASKRVPTFAYQAYFADPTSTAEIENNLDMFLAALFQTPRLEGQETPGKSHIPVLRSGQMRALVKSDRSAWREPPMVISETELQKYLADFKKGGMLGPLSYYRNTRSRFDDEKAAGLPVNFPPHIPVLFIYGDKDSTCPSNYVSRMPQVVQDIKIVQLRNKGHWLLIEASDEVNTHVLSFLSTLPGGRVEKEARAAVRL